MNLDTSIRYVNPALEKLAGFSSSEVIGSKAPYPWWNEETLDETTSNLRRLMSGRVMSVEEVFKKKNGNHFSVEITVVPVKSNGKTKYYVSSWIDVTEQKQLRDNMQLYISECIRAQEEVRKRIARDLHDETAQSLASLYIDIEEMVTMNKRLPVGALRQLERLKVKISNAVEEIRRFSHQLRPALLDQFGLIPSLELLLEEVKNKGQLNCQMRVIGSQIRLPTETELALFRILQEALCNIKKHSKATEAGVTIEFLNGKTRFTISDNGKGFKVPKVLGNLAREGKVGLIGIQERVRLLNGRLSLISEADKGTVVVVEVPR
jgi:PAS domain S-box-containing protein